MQNKSDIQYMQRAFALAKNGLGSVSPNPMVGCVIVCDDQIIGEGWHRKYGKAHAEVNAIGRVRDKSLLSQSTTYVTLEPCAYFGKTPPCADLLIKHQVKRVVIANLDPAPRVNGKGIEKLKRAGIEVATGLMSSFGKQFNQRFFTSIINKKPYVILKWAQTADGFIARKNFDSKWISNTYSRKLVHKWRSEESAILVGKNTAKYDDPALNVRDWLGQHSLRLVIDKNLELKPSLQLFNKEIPTVVYNALKDSESTNIEWVKVDFDNLISDILGDLGQRRVLSLIVEGGADTIGQFIESRAWDEARVFVSKNEFGNGIAAPAIQHRVTSATELGDDVLRYYHKKT